MRCSTLADVREVVVFAARGTAQVDVEEPLMKIRSTGI